MSELDAGALERASSPAIELLGLRTLRTDGAGSAVTGFDAFGRVYIAAAAAEFRSGSRSDAVTVTVEQSTDGISWSEAAAFTFTSDGVQFATIDSPAGRLRVSWAITGQLRSCRLVGVTATPGSLDAPGGIGGALPTGGTTGEVLTKASNADGDADWEAPGGGSLPVILATISQPADFTNPVGLVPVYPVASLPFFVGVVLPNAAIPSNGSFKIALFDGTANVPDVEIQASLVVQNADGTVWIERDTNGFIPGVSPVDLSLDGGSGGSGLSWDSGAKAVVATGAGAYSVWINIAARFAA